MEPLKLSLRTSVRESDHFGQAEPEGHRQTSQRETRWTPCVLAPMLAAALTAITVVATPWVWSRTPSFIWSDRSAPSGVGSLYSSAPSSCDTVQKGYQCHPEISHYFGQYSPYFSVPSNISDEVPHGCHITFAQVLSRHGARDPTALKSISYYNTVKTLQANVRNFTGPYAFLADYQYTLGADQLTVFGEQEMINSGFKFFERYRSLASHHTPFVRSSGQHRVVESAQNWTQGFHLAKTTERGKDIAYPYPILVIPEVSGENNTLSHDLCDAYENGRDNSIAGRAKAKWTAVFVPPIRARLNAGMPGADLTVAEAIDMMDLCPFNTVASVNGTMSPFCNLFTESEWHQYNYYETLDKYYGYSYGNPLAPTQGVGFSNELIARLTNQPVHDETSTNHTLDNDPTTFPLGRQLYADFSHDNDMTGILSALGLYNHTGPLSNKTIVEAEEANGYSAAWTVPFAARVYFEKMVCAEQAEELVRVVVNDRVLPLTQCGGDALGRCSLSSFVDSLGFAKSGGDWDQCFTL